MNNNLPDNVLQPIPLLIGAGCVLLVFLIRYLIRRFRYRPALIDELEGHEFEEYCAGLLRANDFTDVSVTRASGDFGLDILAEKDGVTYGVQCKRYDKPIGIAAVQQAYAGRDYYGRMVGVVMTNQYFTEAAVKCANKLNILLWDRGYLDEMKKTNQK